MPADIPLEHKKAFTVFRSAAEEAEMKRDEQSWDNEGGHMSSTAGRVTHVPRAVLPYVVVLQHHGGEPTERAFATMRGAEAYIKRNTPVPGAILSTTYDRPASESLTSPTRAESAMNDENILARLKVIDQRLRQISSEDAASVLAGGLASAGIHEDVLGTTSSASFRPPFPANAIRFIRRNGRFGSNVAAASVGGTLNLARRTPHQREPTGSNCPQTY